MHKVAQRTRMLERLSWKYGRKRNKPIWLHRLADFDEIDKPDCSQKGGNDYLMCLLETTDKRLIPKLNFPNEVSLNTTFRFKSACLLCVEYEPGNWKIFGDHFFLKNRIHVFCMPLQELPCYGFPPSCSEISLPF